MLHTYSAKVLNDERQTRRYIKRHTDHNRSYYQLSTINNLSSEICNRWTVEDHQQLALTEQLLATSGDSATLRQAIQQKIESEEFLSFISSSPLFPDNTPILKPTPETTHTRQVFVVGFLAGELALAIGCLPRLVLMSLYTVGKQKTKHPYINHRHYSLVQTLLDYAEAIKEERQQYQRHIVFFMPIHGFGTENSSHLINNESNNNKDDNTRYLSLVVKSTLSGEEVYLQTLFFSSIREVKRARLRGTTLRSPPDQKTVLPPTSEFILSQIS